MRVTVGDSGLCCCTCVTYFERLLTPLYVDSAQVLWASFCFRFYIINIIDAVLVVWRTRFKCRVHGPRDGSDARLGKRQTPAACIGEHPITSSS